MTADVPSWNSFRKKKKEKINAMGDLYIDFLSKKKKEGWKGLEFIMSLSVQLNWLHLQEGVKRDSSSFKKVKTWNIKVTYVCKSLYSFEVFIQSYMMYLLVNEMTCQILLLPFPGRNRDQRSWVTFPRSQGRRRPKSPSSQFCASSTTHNRFVQFLFYQ